MTERTASVESTVERGDLYVTGAGAWTIDAAARLKSSLEKIEPAGGASHIDLSKVEAMDTTGAWLLCRLRDRLAVDGQDVNIDGLDDDQAALLARIADIGQTAAVPPADLHPLAAVLARTGKGLCEALRDGVNLLNFLGVVTLAAGRAIVRPGRIRLVPTFSHLERVGVDALPIVGLLAFLIGVVIAYQGADQLRRFGAEIFMINLLGISVFREMGVLMTAIVIAGRSGSAFAAQIGTMQVNQEIDAMRTLGLDPVDMLVMPRVVAMVIALPLLTIYADIMALTGGGLMAVLSLDIPVAQFMDRLRDAVPDSSFWIGIGKAPVFGLLIALTGCHEGLQVSGSAESVGRHTTRSVVIAIFLVLTADALFSVLFSLFHI